MIHLLAGAALAVAAPPEAPSCSPQSPCVQANAAQLFTLADQLYARGDKQAAAEILKGLTQDKHPEFRAEARFRLAAVLESLDNLEGAAQALRDLLAEQPKANRARLELARILGRMGKGSDAQAELAKAEKLGLPPEVEQNVRRFSATLSSPDRHGLTLQMTSGPDSNMNRSTANQFIDTIIAPFQLDADARRQSGLGYTGSAEGYSHDDVAGIAILSDVSARADLYGKSQFDDVQLSLTSGPAFNLGKGNVRAAALYERRSYGGDPYSHGVGGDLDLNLPLSTQTQLALSASSVRQTIVPDAGQDGWRIFVGTDLLHSFAGGTLGRISLRYGRLDARDAPESLRQFGAGLLVARETARLTMFGELDYTRTHGIAQIFLFGKTRHDKRWDLTGGLIIKDVKAAGFSPLLRVTHTESNANVVLYDYRRTRLDFGFLRTF